MTDEQIIQAVDLCANGQEDCRKCPLYSMHSANCIKRLMNITLDLIKRQQAEIERLEADREALINGQETLQKMCADAYKYFAERLDKEAYYCHDEGCAIIELEDVHNVLKELTEVSNGE